MNLVRQPRHITYHLQAPLRELAAVAPAGPAGLRLAALLLVPMRPRCLRRVRRRQQRHGAAHHAEPMTP